MSENLTVLWSLTTHARAYQVALLNEHLLVPYLGHSKSERCMLAGARHNFEMLPRTQGSVILPGFRYLRDLTDAVDANGSNYKKTKVAVCDNILVEIAGNIDAHFVSRNGSPRPKEVVIAFNKRNPQPGDVVLNVYNLATSEMLGSWPVHLIHTAKFRKLFPASKMESKKVIAQAGPAVPYIDYEMPSKKVIDDRAEAGPAVPFIAYPFDEMQVAAYLHELAPIMLGMHEDGEL
eukprot:TRINITY_DN14306_c0_g1_i1.p1 TRINITY_DN14306_c0_g1~~TRINITY_DN14306_c0_g1_i1.p1  ORF type:complete len:264 (+),score=40.80 TRINITY_DN14306_c0_g1_i1:92-793(+)